MAWTPRWSFLAAVLLLVSSGLHRCSTVTASPESCTCQSATAPLLNCSSAGLSSAPRRLRDAVAQLDLSHNLLEAVALDRPHRNLRDVRLGSNGIARLSLCVDRTLGGRVVVGRRGRRCVSWAPALQLLSVERNQLERLPQGLEGSESLQVLQLSFNRISSLRPEDLNNLRQLKELHLQHNLIASLHPQMFQDLARLQVLDLSFNLLTSLHPLMHLSLSNIGADVRLSGNRWQCDCGMRSLRRRMAYDSSRGLQTWSLLCGSPSVLSGRDLLQLEEDDLNCLSAENGPELHRDVTVYGGSEILLSCSAKDAVWWTPGGQASSSQPQAGLVISDITERVTGLYVCVSEEHEVVSVFNLQINKTGGARRKSRSLPRTSQQIIPQNTPSRNQRATQSDLTLAVCLSVFITFAIAFILGVLARPCIDVLWRRVTKKKSSPATISASSVEQTQYDNEAYFNGEEPEHTGTHRERRVTFSHDFREDGNVEYYDTVIGVNQVNLNNDAANGLEAADRDSGSESSFLPCSPEPNLSDIADAGRTHNMEFEPIPDPVVLVQRRKLSSCSDSSLYDKVFITDQMTQGEQHSTPTSHQPAEDSFQQRADSTTRQVEVPQISIEGTSEFPSESFTDWPPHTKNTFLSDPGLWQENGEQFEFSDSVRSTSARSSIMCSSFDDTKLIVAPTPGEKNVDDSSSSDSCVSESEQTQYTVNSDQEEEDIRRNYNAGLKHDAGFEQQAHGVDPIGPSVRLNQGDYRYDTQRPAVRPEESFSYHSSDSDGVYTVKKEQTPSTDLDLQRIPQTKRRVAIKKASDSSSSDESIDETENPTKKQEHGEVDMVVKRRAPLPPADSYSRVESADKTMDHVQKQGDTQVTRLPTRVSQTGSHDSDAQWPALDLEDTTRIKRRLDIKAPSSASDSSSSSDGEDRTTRHATRPGKVDITRPQFQESQPGSHDPDIGWPAVDLEPTMHIKRRLDIKAPSADSDSSSRYESMDETTKKQEHGEVDLVGLPIKEYQSVSRDTMKPQLSALDLDHDTPIRRRAPLPPADSYSGFESADKTMDHMQKQGDTQLTRLPTRVSQTGSHDSDTQWPALDLEDTTRIKRRLDIKAPSSASDSSSSSDSEDETTHHTERSGKGDIARPQFQESQTVSHDPDTRWPALDLEPTMRIKRRLDIKAPSPASGLSASSDGEDQTINQTRKEEQGEVSMSRPPVKVTENISHDPQTQWPALDLEDTIRIKRRLDIKAPSPASDSSSSSDGEDEATNQITEQKHGEVSMARLPVKVSQNASHDLQTQWPALDLEDTIRIKRRLDVKAPSPDSDSSSNSDTEDRTTRHTTRPGKVDFEEPQFHKSQTGSPDPDKGRPALDLEHTMRIKRRLDIKAPSPPSSVGGSMNHTVEGKKEEAIKMSPRHSSSSSDEQEEGVEDLRYPPTTVESKPHSRWPGLDLNSALRVKKRLDIKAPSPPSESPSSSDHESEGWTTNLPAKVEWDRPDVGISSYQPRRKLPGVNVGVPPVKRRLNIRGPHPDPGLSSDSDSEDEYRDHANIGLGVSAISKATDKEFIRSPKTPVINIPHSPKTDPNIKLEKYTVVGEVGDKTTSDNIGITPEINPELESQWATMNLGVSRFRKRLEITSNSPPNLPSSPPPDSPSSSSSESGTGSKSSRTRRQRRGVEIHAEPSLTTETKPLNVSLSLKGRDANSVEVTERLRKDYNLPTTEENSNPDPHLSLAPRRALDIRAPLQRETSSSSKSEDEPLGHSVPDLSLGVPRVKRYLNVKALLPEPSGSPPSGSDSDNEVKRYTENQSRHASNMSGMTDDDSLITYKRLIMKTSSPPGHSFSSTGKGQTVAQEGRFHSVGDRNASFAPKKVSNMSFEDVVKRRMGQLGRTTEVDLPPEIRWTGVGRQLSDLSIPSTRTHLDPTEPELPPPDGDDTRRIRGKADKHPSLASGRAFDRFDDPPSSHNEIFKATSEDRTERKGLSALKAMSSARRKWDTLEEEGAPSLFDDRGSQGDTGFNHRRSENDGEATQSLTRLLLSSTSVERRATDLLYDIPRYRRHDIGGIELPQGAPPPVPVTSPPYEGVGLTLRSPQSRNTKESQNLAGYFDSTYANISEV